MNVRLVWTSKRRVPKNGMLAPSTWPSSITSPVLISLAALQHGLRLHVIARAALVARAPFRRAARAFRRRRPRSAPAPEPRLPPTRIAPSTAPNAMRCMVSSRCVCWSGHGPARSECAPPQRPAATVWATSPWQGHRLDRLRRTRCCWPAASRPRARQTGAAGAQGPAGARARRTGPPGAAGRKHRLCDVGPQRAAPGPPAQAPRGSPGCGRRAA